MIMSRTNAQIPPTGAVAWLDSSSLWSKYGFRDGDSLTENRADIAHGVSRHAVLVHLVRTHLLPALPRPVRVFEISTCHNPIRAEHDETEDFPYMGVWVTDTDIAAAVLAVSES